MPRGTHTNSQKALLLSHLLRQIEKEYTTKRHRRRATKRAKYFLAQYPTYHKGLHKELLNRVAKSMIQQGAGGKRKFEELPTVEDVEVLEKTLTEAEQKMGSQIEALKVSMRKLIDYTKTLENCKPEKDIISGLNSIVSDLEFHLKGKLLTNVAKVKHTIGNIVAKHFQFPNIHQLKQRLNASEERIKQHYELEKLQNYELEKDILKQQMEFDMNKRRPALKEGETNTLLLQAPPLELLNGETVFHNLLTLQPPVHINPSLHRRRTTLYPIVSTNPQLLLTAPPVAPPEVPVVSSNTSAMISDFILPDPKDVVF